MEKEFKKGDKVKVRGCFSDFKHRHDHVWFEGEFLGMCLGYVYKYRVKVNGKYSDWKNCEKV
jgi:hypothetical protein